MRGGRSEGGILRGATVRRVYIEGVALRGATGIDALLSDILIY